MEKKDRIKQVIIWRDDLKAPKGKVAAQVAHASMLFLVRGASFGYNRDVFKRIISNEVYSDKKVEMIQKWLENGMTKVCLKIDTEESMKALYDKATKMGVISNFVVDEGRTVFNGVHTLTCLALGPEISSVLDTITGDLKLL